MHVSTYTTVPRQIFENSKKMENGNCKHKSTSEFSSNSIIKETENELNYSNYLNLNTLLTCQNLQSVKNNKPAHHEHLFIIIHQVYELWFKQIIFELDSILVILRNEGVKNQNTYEIIKRLQRIILIFKLLVELFPILETMTSNDFLEFREFLCSASGFQSLQFRLLENKFGLKKENRTKVQKDYLQQFSSESTNFAAILLSEKEPTLFAVIQEWLEEFPEQIINYKNFKNLYKNGIKNFHSENNDKFDNTIINLKDAEISNNKNIQFYESIFDTQIHKELLEKKIRKLSHKALIGAFIIIVYQNEPEFNSSFQIIRLITEIDLYLFKWRLNHMLMVQKMIGSRLAGTGGSSGYNYLQLTLNDEYKVFIDFVNISSYLIPYRYIPPFNAVKK